jgi:hypothetical protein
MGEATSPQLAIASSLALVFALLGALHVFWALGGRLGFAPDPGFDSALSHPTNAGSSKK